MGGETTSEIKALKEKVATMQADYEARIKRLENTISKIAGAHEELQVSQTAEVEAIRQQVEAYLCVSPSCFLSYNHY